MTPHVVAQDAIWLVVAITAQAVVPERLVGWVRALAIYITLELFLHKPAEDLVAMAMGRFL